MLINIGVSAISPAVDSSLDDIYVDETSFEAPMTAAQDISTIEGAPVLEVEDEEVFDLTSVEHVLVGEIIHPASSAEGLDVSSSEEASYEDSTNMGTNPSIPSLKRSPARLIPPPTCYVDLLGASIDPTVFPTRARVDVLIPVQTPTVSGEVRCSVRRDISDVMVVIWDEVGLQASAEDFHPTHAQKLDIYRKATQMAAYFTK